MMWSCECVSVCGRFFLLWLADACWIFVVISFHGNSVNGWRPIRWRASANICTRCHKSPEQLWHVTVSFALPLTALVLFSSDQQQGLHSQDVLCATALQRVCVAQEEAAEERRTSVSCCVVTRWLRSHRMRKLLPLSLPLYLSCRRSNVVAGWSRRKRQTLVAATSHRSDCPHLTPSSDPLGPATTVAALYLECWCNTRRTTMLSDVLLDALEIVAQKAKAPTLGALEARPIVKSRFSIDFVLRVHCM